MVSSDDWESWIDSVWGGLELLRSEQGPEFNDDWAEIEKAMTFITGHLERCNHD